MKAETKQRCIDCKHCSSVLHQRKGVTMYCGLLTVTPTITDPVEKFHTPNEHPCEKYTNALEASRQPIVKKS